MGRIRIQLDGREEDGRKAPSGGDPVDAMPPQTPDDEELAEESGGAGSGSGEPRIVSPTDEEIASYGGGGEPRGETGDSGSPDPAVAEKAARAEEYLAHLQRLQAEFDNYRKRVDRERAELSHRAVADLMGDLLDTLDAFERALASDHLDQVPASFREGMEMVQRTFFTALGRRGLKRIQAVGEPFDPNLHEALMRVETEDHPSGTVVEEIKPGYLIGEMLLRPAAVKVAHHPDEE